MDSPDYQKAREAINNMRRKTASSAICYRLLIPGEDISVYIFDASDANVLPCGALEHIDTSYLRNPGDPFKSYIFTSEVYGRVRPDGVPCCSNPEDGIYSYLTADIPISVVVEKARSFILDTALMALAVTALICAGASFLLRHNIVSALKRITRTSKNYVEACDKVDHKAGSEIFKDLPNGGITEFDELIQSGGYTRYDMICLDHDLGDFDDPTGYDCVMDLDEEHYDLGFPCPDIFVHTGILTHLPADLL